MADQANPPAQDGGSAFNDVLQMVMSGLQKISEASKGQQGGEQISAAADQCLQLLQAALGGGQEQAPAQGNAPMETGNKPSAPAM